MASDSSRNDPAGASYTAAVTGAIDQQAAGEQERDLRFDTFEMSVRSIAGARQSLPHIKALDGLRGLAVVGVVLYHLDLAWMPGGFLGVSLFFTLSGFLITSLLLAEEDRTSSIDFTSFWVRRFRRLLPAAWVGVLLAVVSVAAAGDAEQLRRLPADAAASLAQLANWRFVVADDSYTSAYQTPSPLLHYWSLAIEEQFYLVYPVLVAILVRCRASRRTWGIVIGTMLAGSAVLTLVLFNPANTGAVYFNSFTRVGEILAGVALAVAFGRWWTRPVDERTGPWLAGDELTYRVARVVVPLAALVVTVGLWMLVGTGDLWLYQGGLFVVAAVSCVLVGGILLDGPAARILSSRPLVWLGLISYGIYVYHWPLFQWLDADYTGLDGPALVVLRLAATLAASVASYQFVERPLRRGELGFTLRSGALAAVFVVAVIGSTVWLSGTAQQRAVDDVRTVLATATVVTQPPVTSPTAAPPPDAPPVGPPPKVLLIGDSLLHQALDLIRHDLNRQGSEVRALGGPSETLLGDQAKWVEELSWALDAFEPDVIVVESCCGHYDAQDPYLEDGVALDVDSEQLWQVWERTVEEVVVMSRRNDTAVVWALAPPAQATGFYGPIGDRIDRANEIAQRVASRNPEVALVDWGVLTGPGRQYARSLPDTNGDQVIIRAEDGFHFADAGKKVLAEMTVDAVNDAWRAAVARGSARQPA
jgi:peptidoglycan/LPS O-acetylase OafA/YrhL